MSLDAKRILEGQDFQSLVLSVKPRAVILLSLGGYTAKMEKKASALDVNLNEFLKKNRLVIFPGRNGLEFVSMDVLIDKCNLDK